MLEKTLTIIKPNAVENKHTGEMLHLIEKAGFRIIALKMTVLSSTDIINFYYIHKDKTFFPDLCSFMTSGPVVVAILEKENAVLDFRELVGSTDPSLASVGTLRKLFGENKTKNAIHASDSKENAWQEISYFFSTREISNTTYQSTLVKEKDKK